MKQRGFTLIELVVVIVILGILAATALPKFVDLSGDAEDAAIKGVAGGYGSAAAVNYGGCSVTKHDTAGANAAKCSQVNSCADVGNLVLPTVTIGTTATATTYYLAADTAAATNGTAASCSLQKCKTATDCDATAGKNYVATYSVIGAGN